MAQITRAHRELRTKAQLDEMSKIFQARRAEPAQRAGVEALKFDVTASDGTIHLGPYTRGACLAEGLRRQTIEQRRKPLTGLLRKFITAKLKDGATKSNPIVIPSAFTFVSGRLFFFARTALPNDTSAILCLPQIAAHQGGGVQYSGNLAKSYLIHIEALGTLRVNDDASQRADPPIFLVLEGE